MKDEGIGCHARYDISNHSVVYKNNHRGCDVATQETLRVLISAALRIHRGLAHEARACHAVWKHN